MIRALLVLLILAGCRDFRSATTPFRPRPRVTTVSLPAGTVGVPYSATLRATGGNGVYVYRLNSGALPDGLVLDSLTGEISGTPTGGS